MTSTPPTSAASCSTLWSGAGHGRLWLRHAGHKAREGYLRVRVDTDDGGEFEQEILYPANPGSVY